MGDKLFTEFKWKKRFKSVVLTAGKLGLLIHLFLIPYFYLLGVTEMGNYNIGSSLFFLTMLFLIYKEQNVKVIFLLTSVEVVLHGFLATHYVGYDCNFILFVFILPSVFLLNPKWTIWQGLVYFLGIVATYILNTIVYKEALPVYAINKSVITYTGMTIILLIAITIFLIIFYYSKIVNINDVALRNANKELMAKNEDKKAVIKEIHHRIKNNLQMVISLLRLQSSSIEDKEVVEMFKKAQKRIFSMALLHEKMQQEYDLEQIDVQEHFRGLIKGLVASYAVGKEINLDLKVSKIDLGMQTLAPLGLIVNEIITNSVKYAFKNVEKGEIKVHLRHIENHTYEIIIADNGVGLVEQKENNGLGSKLVKIFIKQLNGSIERLEQPGTAFRILFKKVD